MGGLRASCGDVAETEPTLPAQATRYLGPTLERRYRELFATALDFAVARMGNHERLRFEPATQVPDEAAPEHTT